VLLISIKLNFHVVCEAVKVVSAWSLQEVRA
jgi:hypothetical protein